MSGIDRWRIARRPSRLLAGGRRLAWRRRDRAGSGRCRERAPGPRPLKARLPKTAIGSVDCATIGGLCEVIAGDNLFYVDAGARYLVIGRVYDMETRQDITAARLLEMNPDMLVGGPRKRIAA